MIASDDDGLRSPFIVVGMDEAGEGHGEGHREESRRECADDAPAYGIGRLVELGWD